MNILALVRENIAAMEAYSSARSLYTSGVFFDANENPFNLFDAQAGGLEVNRYPDGKNLDLRTSLGKLNGLPASQVAVGNGSDELIDILLRIFCRPGLDEIIICPPTFGMYKVSAHLNDVKIKEVPLVNYALDIAGIKAASGPNTKLLFICNPNNPTGTTADRTEMLRLAGSLNLIVVVDEAYGDFMDDESMIPAIAEFENLVVLRTLSKAFALAGARLGIVMASELIISLVQKVKFPYNINMLSTSLILKALENTDEVSLAVSRLKEMRKELEEVVSRYDQVTELIPSQANFLCIRFKDSNFVFNGLVARGIITRKVNPAGGMENTLRISVGTVEQNKLLTDALEEILGKSKIIS